MVHFALLIFISIGEKTTNQVANIKCKVMVIRRKNHKRSSCSSRNGKKYAGEIHFLHINPDTGQVAVLGMFMESIRSQTINETTEKISKTSVSTVNEWRRYFDAAQQLKQTSSTTAFSVNLSSLMGDSLTDFWRYAGSLTTPPCTEGIIWTMFRDPIIFTESELESFRINVYFEDYRGPQPLYDRVVYRSFENEISSKTSDYSCCSSEACQITSKLFPMIVWNLYLLTRDYFSE